MKLGFVSAILPEISFEELVDYAADCVYKCIETCCWPMGKASNNKPSATNNFQSSFIGPGSN